MPSINFSSWSPRNDPPKLIRNSTAEVLIVTGIARLRRMHPRVREIFTTAANYAPTLRQTNKASA